jgi:hypothetical protein
MIYDLSILDKLVAKDELVKFEKDNLVQYDYTDKTRYDGIWNRYTLFNRGNIYEKHSGELIAKSLPKFFNYDELPQNLQNNLRTQKFNCTEKYDGCLGIIYQYEDTIYCNTRNGFDNPITKVMYELISDTNIDLSCLSIMNLVVEIICPESHMQVDYKDKKELRLITGYYKVTGTELSYVELKDVSSLIGIPVVEEFPMDWEDLFDYQNAEYNNTEGYVLRFAGNLRVKIKNKHYIELYKEHLDVTPAGIIMLLLNNSIQEVENKIKSLPDELYETAEHILLDLLDQITTTKMEVKNLYNEIKDSPDMQTILEQSKYKDMIEAYINDNTQLFHQLAIMRVLIK